ncbi:MAG: hypothetical protein ACLSHW_04955 [Lachnospiraceae bacterium]
MRKLNKTAACGILAAALAAGTLSGCSKAIDGTKTVATVGDEKSNIGSGKLYGKRPAGTDHELL